MPSRGAEGSGVDARVTICDGRPVDDTLLADLADEHAALDMVVGALAEQDWRLPTPCPGWTVLDQIHHLAVSDLAALRCVQGRHDEVWAASSPAGPTPTPEPAVALASWRRHRRELSEAFAGLDARHPVIWGAGPMAARSLATARLMETWAHGLDCHAALGTAPTDTDRLRHVAHLAHRTLPHAFAVAGEEPPDPFDQLRIELTAPDGFTVWRHGDASAPQTISGPAGEWCRVAVRRLDPALTSLRADGPLAERALAVARCFLAL